MVNPHWDLNDVPLCTSDGCDDYDGKRCRLLGCRPSSICEPAVIDMAKKVRKDERGWIARRAREKAEAMAVFRSLEMTYGARVLREFAEEITKVEKE